jgi:hypothetical protein
MSEDEDTKTVHRAFAIGFIIFIIAVLIIGAIGLVVSL